MSRILRLPLVVTAIADVEAGYLLALLPRLERFDWRVALLLAGTAAGLYLFGMVENDLVDIRRDRLLKQPRPLVTGEIGIAAAVVLLLLTGVLAAACATHLTGGSLAMAIAAFAAINLYNLGAKHGPAYVVMGVMGLCRLLNYCIGVAAVGLPSYVSVNLFLPTGPLWVRHAMALFFVTSIVSGYSVAARYGHRASTRPWQAVFVLSAAAGFVMIAVMVAQEGGGFFAPVARVLAALLLAGLWPGGLWSATPVVRKPQEYSPFIERALYWIIVMDAAFVLDGLLAS